MYLFVLLLFILPGFGLELNLVPPPQNVPKPSVRFTNSDDINLSLFKNPGNVIKLLDQAKKSYAYDNEYESWYSYEFLGDVDISLLNTTYPATDCLDNTAGGSGSGIDLSYEVGLLVTNSIEPSASITMYTFTLAAMIGMEVGPSKTFSGSFTCGVEKGMVGQLTLQPFLVTTPAIRRTKVSFSGGGLVEETEDDNVDDDYTIAPMNLLGERLPAHLHCVTGASQYDPNLRCFEQKEFVINPKDIY
ncbi:hypothetical protein CLIB1423_18S00936 [[Candida] railenensis]|uniref:Uncharacterized protein n=1 Tax=[Candida] railenensis TaxID=45579 RepID=A0A9P0QU84_9ASCO|nr:hypothetical protein CLIB1423_18S00936 [[Candida] railenensis]